MPLSRQLSISSLETARRGPSAGFSQGTDFLVLDDPGPRLGRGFWEFTDDPQFPRESSERAVSPPVVVLAFADPDRYLARYREPDKMAFGLGEADAWPVKFWDTDTAMVCMLLLLAATDAGLGGWLFGVVRGEQDLFREFGVPADRNLIAAIGLGYPGVDGNPRGSAFTRSRRSFDEMVHRNRWSPI